MALLGALLKKGLAIRKRAERKPKPPFVLQKKELNKLLFKAQDTAFGRAYQFDKIIDSMYDADPHKFYEEYTKRVPIFTYNEMFTKWWHRALEGQEDVCWPGKTMYFALSSGTSEAATKHIPITKAMTKAIQKTSIQQILSLPSYNVPNEAFEKGVLMLGGSTKLTYKGPYFEGDLSGIQAKQLPFWFQSFYKPGKQIAENQNWAKKLDEITLQAKDWDISVIVGVPAWIQLLMEKIIAHYNVKTIHDIWPNLTIYTHGGVSFEPYKKGFESLLAKPLQYMETYLASEGFIAYQARPEDKGMSMSLGSGIFFEFIPFTDDNFNADGDLVSNPQTLMIDQVEEGKDYALLLSTCAGTWRYMIGDVIRFIDKEKAEIVITGRTKHYISMCGEHLSVENMNKAIQLTNEDFNIDIREFAVAGVPHGNLFAHQWYIGTDDEANADELIQKIDKYLNVLNDDYRVERQHALRDVSAKVLPTSVFYDFMRMRGKEGGQNKFPRVLKKQILADWEQFLKDRNL
ncbi:GH3 auxin-responsive promoter [Flexibacter flexilis DSM 6793]|uniref:GH3 auxin-responsive promoter n=1 Tax=Flexibacter flexilis DSM 6793 TaxID=927664 RepID=A0A1I1LJI0_9BACT|nr:GH3 auxin-responsive promoter family protein [Flexibacter flexilis]SFC70493.1 GH3 auxin-responsive promoter [Flexibacter flexilis DSM 6793]